MLARHATAQHGCRHMGGTSRRAREELVCRLKLVRAQRVDTALILPLPPCTPACHPPRSTIGEYEHVSTYTSTNPDKTMNYKTQWVRFGGFAMARRSALLDVRAH